MNLRSLAKVEMTRRNGDWYTIYIKKDKGETTYEESDDL